MSDINTFSSDQFTITTSLTDNKIYIGVTNNINYVFHEGTFDKSNIRLSFDIESVFALMNRCFAAFSKKDETVTSNMVRFIHKCTTNSLQLEFSCIMEGFLNIEFDLLLREKKTASNEQQLSTEINRQKSQIEKLILVEKELREEIDIQNKRMKEMDNNMKVGMELLLEQMNLQNERIWETFGHLEICLSAHNSSDYASFPVSIKSLNLYSCNSRGFPQNNYGKIKYFYQLEELIMQHYHINNLRMTTNTNVQRLFLSCSAGVPWTSNEHDYKLTINIILKNFPNLRDLRVKDANLTNLTFESDFKLNPNHKINKLILENCSGINKPEIQSYCTQNSIELIIV